MMDPILTLTDAPDAAVRAVIADGLNGFNDEVTGYDDRRPLAVLVKDPKSGKVLGGMAGRTSLGPRRRRDVAVAAPVPSSPSAFSRRASMSAWAGASSETFRAIRPAPAACS
jgi:hypothetical protein